MNLDELVAGEGEVLEGIAEGIDGNVQVRGATRESTLYRAAVLGRLGTTMNVMNEVQQHQVHELADIKNKLERMQSQLRTLAYAPARRAGGAVEAQPRTRRGEEIRVGASNQGQDTRPATLCNNPKLLSVLWDEYLNGVGGRLPARLFSAAQRGRCKAIYSNRNKFWQLMERLINHGYTASTALDKIERVYPGTLTQKLVRIRRDENNGGHNQLCPGPPPLNLRRGRHSRNRDQ